MAKTKTTSANPFEIKKDMEFTGNRAAANQQYIKPLAEQLMKLKVGDKMTSVNIPTTICPNRGSAGNLLLGLKRHLNGGREGKSKAYFTSKGIWDDKKVYLGTRIWRLA